MMRLRRIFIQVTNPNGPIPAISPDASPATSDPAVIAALDTIAKIQGRLSAGDKFADLAKLYSQDPDAKVNGGDLGILYSGMQPAADPTILNGALSLSANGEVTPTPVISSGGYNLLERVSASDNHPADENRLYADALFLFQEHQGSLKADAYAAKLRAKSNIVIYAAR
jgi:parvulin-like peptidyl-prolyl isomerase